MARRRRRQPSIDDVLRALSSDSVADADAYIREELGGETGGARQAQEEAGRVGWSILGDFIYQANLTGGYYSVVVFGKQGAGKSVYAIKVAYDVLRRLGKLGPGDGYDKVYRRYMVFNSLQLIEKVEQARSERIPVLVWDDAGVHGGSYLHFTDPHMAKAITDIFRVIRTRVAAVILTTPNPRDILKPVRDTDTIVVKVHEVNREWSRAHGYKNYLLPSGKPRIVKVFIEDYRRRLPRYQEYMRLRDSYVDYAIRQLQQLLFYKSIERNLKRAKLIEKARALIEEAGMDEAGSPVSPASARGDGNEEAMLDDAVRRLRRLLQGG